MCKWEGNSMESEPSPQSFGTESGAATAKGKLLSRFHDIFGTAMMAQAEIHVQFSDKLVRSWQMAWNPWICRPQRAWVRLRTWRIVKQSEQIWAVWGSKIRFRKVKRFWKILDFFTLPLWCSPVFLRDLKEQEIADPWFRRQYNSKCGQCGHVPGGSLDETTHQKNYDNSLQVKISLWKHVKWWMFFHVFPSSSWQETYWLAADFSRGNKKLFSFSDCMGSIGFVWRELSDSDLAFGQLKKLKNLKFLQKLQVCTSNDWSISTSEVSCTMCWSLTSHVRLAPQCGGCSVQVWWFFGFQGSWHVVTS